MDPNWTTSPGQKPVENNCGRPMLHLGAKGEIYIKIHNNKSKWHTRTPTQGLANTLRMRAAMSPVAVAAMDSWSFKHQDYTCLFYFYNRYGDRCPQSIPAKIFAMVWFLIGLVIFSLFIGSLTAVLTVTVVSMDLYVASASSSSDGKVFTVESRLYSKLKMKWEISARKSWDSESNHGW